MPQAQEWPRANYVTWALLAGLLLWTGLAYFQRDSLRGEFLYDDNPFIVRNEEIRHLDHPFRFFTTKETYSLSGDFRIYRPLAALSFALNYHFSGLDPMPYHLVNIVGHLVNTAMLFLLLRLIVRSDVVAGLATLFFAIHPRNVEAVTWIASRSNVLFMFFFLAGFLCHLRVRQGGKAGLVFAAGSAAAYALAVLSKEMAITYPAVLLLFDVVFGWPWERKTLRRRAAYYGLLGLVGLGYLVVRTLVVRDVSQTLPHGGGWIWNWLFGIKCVAVYVLMTLAPVRLSIVYSLSVVQSAADWTLWASLATVTAMIAAIWTLRRRAPAVSFGLGFFLVTILPVAQVLPIKTTVNDRFLYLPMVGLGLALAWGAVALVQRAGFRPAAVATVGATTLAVMLFFTVQTVQRQKAWVDFPSLFAGARELYPDVPITHQAMGHWYLDQGEPAKAIKELETYAQMMGTEADPRGILFLALAYVKAEQSEKVVPLLERLAELHPDLTAAHLELGRAYLAQKRPERAVPCLRRAIELRQDLAPGYAELARALTAFGRPEEAIEALQQGRRALPQDALISVELGNALYSAGRVREALTIWQEGLSQHPDSPELAANVAWIYVTEKGDMAQPAEGLRMIRSVVERFPDKPAYLSTLSYALEANGQIEEAVRVDGQLLGLLGKDEPIRAETEAHVAALQKKLSTETRPPGE